jgi:glycosyltransferase involved in cell wall biosynthesis
VLRILHVTPFGKRAWAYGGIPRVVGELSRGMVERGHQVTVCSTDARDADGRLDHRGAWVDDGVAQQVFPNLSNTAAYHLQVFLPIGLSRWLSQHARDFDVAHIHACRNLPASVASFHLRRAGVPIVLTPHGTARRIERRLWAKWVFDNTIGRNMFDVDRVLAVSEAEKRDLAALGLPERILAVLDNPVENTRSEPGDFRRRHSLPWREIVLFLGKLTPGKHVDRLVRAFQHLARESVGLVIAGNDMGSGGPLKRLVKSLGLWDRTRFLGLLTGDERLAALADADVVAHPAMPEAFGLVPMEALAAGTPVVVSAGSGCGELVSSLGGGRVVNGNDPGVLASALHDVLNERTRFARDAAAAGEQVRSRFARARVCEELERHYTAVLR